MAKKWIPNKRLKTLTDKQFIDELNKDPNAVINHDKIVYDLSVKYGLSVTMMDRICNSQFGTARNMMSDENLPNIKFTFLGKLFVNKGRRYYIKLENDLRKQL